MWYDIDCNDTQFGASNKTVRCTSFDCDLNFEQWYWDFTLFEIT